MLELGAHCSLRKSMGCHTQCQGGTSTSPPAWPSCRGGSRRHRGQSALGSLCQCLRTPCVFLGGLWGLCILLPFSCLCAAMFLCCQIGLLGLFRLCFVGGQGFCCPMPWPSAWERWTQVPCVEPLFPAQLFQGLHPGQLLFPGPAYRSLGSGLTGETAPTPSPTASLGTDIAPTNCWEGG